MGYNGSNWDKLHTVSLRPSRGTENRIKAGKTGIF